MLAGLSGLLVGAVGVGRWIECDHALGSGRPLVELEPDAGVIVAGKTLVLFLQLAQIAFKTRQRTLDGVEIGFSVIAAEVANERELGHGGGL